MGTQADAVRHLEQVRAMLSTDVGRLATAGARAAKNEAQAVAGTLGPLSRMGRRGVRLGVGYDVDGARIILKLRPAGAWVIAERRSAAHSIAPKRARRRAQGVGRGGAAVGSAGTYRARVDHPGGAGRRGISRAFGRARPAIPAAIHDEQVRRMRAIYG